MDNMFKTAKSSFSEYVVHGLLPSSDDLCIQYPVFSRETQYVPLSSVVNSIQSFRYGYY